MRQWLRKWRILITDKNDKAALNVSDLHCKFEVHIRRMPAFGYAVVHIYNLAKDTEQKIIEEGDRVIIEAGYEGETKQEVQKDGTTKTVTTYTQYGKIFDGQVTYPLRRKESNVDYVLDLVCVDGDNQLNLNFIKKTVNRGLNQRQALTVACNDGSVVIPSTHVSESLGGQRTARGKVFFGQPRDYIQDISRGNNAVCWIEGGKLNVTKLTDIPEGEALVVTPSTGLIGMPQQTQFGVNFRLLLNPAIKLMTMVQLKNSEVNENQVQPNTQQTPLDDDWIYQATEVTHFGDTRGQEWYTDVSGISRYGKGSLPALLGNSGQNPNGA
jgi:hypothetical protein